MWKTESKGAARVEEAIKQLLPPCQIKCPINEDIQRTNVLISLLPEEMEQARPQIIEISDYLYEKNPFFNICGYICGLCELECNYKTKGGAIRRVTWALDARLYRVIPIAAPTDEERAHHYLWRFWRHLSRAGRVTIFDRSWYGRVLVERVEGFCSEPDWQRAYGEINDFEEQLARHGAVLVKFWLQISAEEQLRRFKEREVTGFKRHKITDDDWRNRDKWPLYEQAVCDMIDRTSTDIAPWTLIAAEDKRHARIAVLETLCTRIEQAL